MEEQEVDDCGLERLVDSFRGTLAEAQERIARLESMVSKQLLPVVRKELAISKRRVRMLEDERERVSAAWEGERRVMVEKLRVLKAEVGEARTAAAAAQAQPCLDSDRGSEELDLRALAERKGIENRSVLGPISPEVVRARAPASKERRALRDANPGKENVCENNQRNKEGDEDVQRLRRDNEQLRLKMRTLSKENKGLKSQYNALLIRFPPGKSDPARTISNQALDPDLLQAALVDGLQKPPKFRKRNLADVEQQGDLNAFGVNGANNLVSDFHSMPPQAASEIDFDLVAAPLWQEAADADRVCSEGIKKISEFPSKIEALAENYEGNPKHANKILDGGLVAIAGDRIKPAEHSVKQPAKTTGFKFVEPVRKKAEREFLQATDCKQCKKFYDAVLVGDAHGLVQSRCKHLESSRHRYRDLPPATPEGFWNIGFDSDL